MAFLRSRSCNLTLMGSAISHILRRSQIPLISQNSPTAARALVRHYNSSSSHEPGTLAKFGICVDVPQQKAYVVERFGDYHRTLVGGRHFLIPFVDRIAYVHSLEEESYLISGQSAVTCDIINILIDGLVYLRVVDPYLVSYLPNNPILKAMNMVQSKVLYALGKMELVTVIKEREVLNEKSMSVINKDAVGWGVECIRYEIKDIRPLTEKMRLEEGLRRLAKMLEEKRNQVSKLQRGINNP